MSAFGDSAFALLIGVGRFEDPQYSDKPLLPHALNDVHDVASALVQSLGWNSDHIVALAGDVTKNDVMEGFRTVGRQARRTGTPELFLLYISTHGHPYKAVRRAYDVALATTDASFADPVSTAETALTRYRLGAYIDTVPARQKAVIIDACYAASVAAVEDFVPFDSRELDAALLASSTRRAYASSAGRNSDFTAALLDGIASRAGRAVGLQDLFVFASQKSEIESPYLDNKGRYILLGTTAADAPQPRLSRESIDSFLRSLVTSTAERSVQNPLAEPHVSRKELQDRFDRLIGEHRSPIIVIGPPGAGKTTFLIRGVSRLLMGGVCALWVTPADVRGGNATDVLDRVFAAAGAGVTFNAATKASGRAASWVLVLDGVNEWATPLPDTRRLLDEFADVALALRASLVISCRDESWRMLRDAFRGDDKPNADIVVSNFEDAEIEQIVARVGRRVPANALSILKRPLFVRMLLDSDEDAADRSIDLQRLFEEYIRRSASAIGARTNVTSEGIVDALTRCAGWLQQSGRETMPMERFLQMIPESISVGLLEEGLCVRSKGEVGFESETLLEYLISLGLPDDPFTGNLQERTLTDPWWGAAAFKAARLEPRRLAEVLEGLAKDWRTQEYALSLIGRSPDPGRYVPVVESIVGRSFVLTDTRSRFLDELFDRRDPQAHTVALRAVRAFVIGNYGSWREKDWDKIAPAQFEAQLSERAGADIGLFILKAHAADPSTTMETLVEWLGDSTYLKDREAKVEDIAALFLKQIGCRDLDGVMRAVERVAAAADGITYHVYVEITHVLDYIVQHGILVPSAKVAAWTASPIQTLRMAAMALLPGVPAAETASLLATLNEYVRVDTISEVERAQAIAAIGRRKSRATLNYLAFLSQLEECQSGVIEAYCRIVTDFPNEVVRRIAAFTEMRSLRDDVIEALNKFFLGYIGTAPDEAIAFFRRLAAERAGRYARDMAYTIHTLNRPVTSVTQFVEEQIRHEQSGNALELYHYYLRKVRDADDRDVPWMTRWIESGDGTYGLVSYLFNGDIRYDTKADIYVRLDGAGPLYENNLYDVNAAGAAFATRFCKDPRYDSLSSDGQVWITEIMNGHSVWEAARAITKSRYRDLERRVGKSSSEEEHD